MNNTNADTINYNPPLGEYISTTINKIVALANQEMKCVVTTFNEIDLVAHPFTTTERALEMYFTEEQQRRQEKYYTSKEYKDKEVKRKKEIEEAQDIIDTCISNLKEVLEAKDTEKVIAWLKIFSAPADRSGTYCNFSFVIGAFIKAGYKANAFVEEGALLETHKEWMGLYIIGQAINCMRKNMPPHPIIYKFIEQYEAMK